MAVTEQWVQECWQAGRVAPLKFATFNWLLDARAALYCVDKNALVVSDLHFEKGSFLRRHGSLIPATDTRQTLALLASLIDDYTPHTLVCLGDSFHDLNSTRRMLDQDIVTLQRLVQQVPQWVWVVGNHDPVIDGVGGEVLAHLQWGKLTLRHEPDVTDMPQLFGHFHPKHRLVTKQYRLKGKCFVLAQNRMVLPALGHYTGGLSIDDSALTAWLPKPSRQVWLIQQNKIFALG